MASSLSGKRSNRLSYRPVSPISAAPREVARGTRLQHACTLLQNGSEVCREAGRVLSLSIVIGVIDVILMTALSTLGAFLYNICSALVGGLQLTLTDD